MNFPHSALNLNDKTLFKPHLSHLESLRQAASIIIEALGEDSDREGLLRTPSRFAKAFTEMCSGYQLTVQDAVGEGIFKGEGRLVSVRDVQFFSLCEHHMLPFWGTASVAYIPDEKILGLSKIPRLVDVFAKRLQVQERLTQEVAEGIQEVIKPKAVAVRIKASHMCMMMRGVKRTGSETVTEFSLGLETLNPLEQERLWKSIE